MPSSKPNNFQVYKGGGRGNPPLDSSGSGGDNTGMEARIAKLESDMKHVNSTLTDIKQDVRELRSDVKQDIRELRGDMKKLLFIYGAGFVALLGVMAKGFKWF